MAGISITREEIIEELNTLYNKERTLEEGEFTLETAMRSIGKSKEATRLWLKSQIEYGIMKSVDKIIDGHKMKVYKLIKEA